MFLLFLCSWAYVSDFYHTWYWPAHKLKQWYNANLSCRFPGSLCITTKKILRNEKLYSYRNPYQYTKLFICIIKVEQQHFVRVVGIFLSFLAIFLSSCLNPTVISFRGGYNNWGSESQKVCVPHNKFSLQPTKKQNLPSKKIQSSGFGRDR